MTTTCANCRAEVGDAAYCPECGQQVLSPQSAPDWRTDTTERPAVRPPFEPPPAVTTPGPPRFPLYADQAGDSVEAHVDPRSTRRPLRRTRRTSWTTRTTTTPGTAARWPGCPG